MPYLQPLHAPPVVSLNEVSLFPARNHFPRCSLLKLKLVCWSHLARWLKGRKRAEVIFVSHFIGPSIVIAYHANVFVIVASQITKLIPNIQFAGIDWSVRKPAGHLELFHWWMTNTEKGPMILVVWGYKLSSYRRFSDKAILCGIMCTKYVLSNSDSHCPVSE